MRRYCGREFTDHELELIRALIAHRPAYSRAQLSQLTCQALHWYKPDGGLKEMSCRVVMLRMHADGLIELPPPRAQRPQSRIRFTSKTDPRAPLELPVHALGALDFELVRRGLESLPPAGTADVSRLVLGLDTSVAQERRTDVQYDHLIAQGRGAIEAGLGKHAYALLVAAQKLREIGVKVDLQAMDWSTWPTCNGASIVCQLVGRTC